MAHSYVPWLVYMCHDSFVLALLQLAQVSWFWLLLVWHTCMSHVSYEWGMYHMNESWPCVSLDSDSSQSGTYGWGTVTSVSHLNESCLMWMSHVSREWVMFHMDEALACLISMSHAWEWSMLQPKGQNPRDLSALRKWISFTGNGFLFRFMKSEISRFAIASPDSTLVFRFTLS